MMKVVFITIILCSLMYGVYAQQKSQAEDRIRRNQPGVYLTFERAGQVKVSEPGEERERVWLRFHNNTRWPIMLDMSGAPRKEYGDAELYYDVLSARKLIFHGECHVCSRNSVAAGKSLVFSVPRGDLAEGRGIRVLFSYGWEDQNDVTAGREAEHYAYFYASQLPKSSAQSTK